MNNSIKKTEKSLKRHCYLVLFVLPRVGEARNDCCYSRSTCYFTSIDHNQEFHEVIINFPAPTLDNVDILSSNTFSDFHTMILK